MYNKANGIAKSILAAALAAFILMGTVSCKENTPAETTPSPESVETETETEEKETETEAPAETEPEEPAETEAEPEPETEAPAETEPDITLPSADELLEEADSEITAFSDEDDTPADVKPAEPVPVPEPAVEAEPERRYNYLNGKTLAENEENRRPVAIMLNNLKKSLPQEGLCSGEIYYECAAEGGITRIMMLVDDYEKLGTVGSVRSSRDYFIDFIANHDALYVHAGGSEQAYAKISWRGINNLDGVNMYLPNTFWRDSWRMNNVGYEHSLMTSGEGIADGIKYKKYRTELDESYTPMFKFYDEKTDNKLVGSPAKHVKMQSTSLQTVDFVYDEKTGEYLRYQYGGNPHIDGTTKEQLSVKNVLILFTEIDQIPGDTAGRLAVGTVGSGQGYYITNGKRKVVNWSRDGKTSVLHIEYRNGDELILNCGKTFICVVDDMVAGRIDFLEE